MRVGEFKLTNNKINKLIDLIEEPLNDNNILKVWSIISDQDVKADLGLDGFDLGQFDGFMMNSGIDLLHNIQIIPEYFFASAVFDDENITIPSNIRSLGNRSFSWSNIREITFEGKLHKIDTWAFKYSSLNGVVDLSKGIHILGDAAFDSTEIKEIILPNTIDKVGRLFVPRSCKITYLGTKEEWEAMINRSSKPRAVVMNEIEFRG